LAVAIDNAGNVWSVGAGPLLEETNQVGAVKQTINSGGGLNTPAGVAIDGNGQVWVTDGNNAVSLFSNAGAPISPSGGIADPSVLSTPSGVAVDVAGSVWIANKGSNSVTRILGGAAPAAPLATAAATNTTGAKP
jgi:secreted PhoX family phosphatase